MLFSALGWRMLGIGAIAAISIGLWVRGNACATRVSTLEKLVESIQTAAAVNAEFARIQAASASRMDAIAALNAKRKQDLRFQSDLRRKAILHVPPEDDAPLAPVLRRQLDRLPEPPIAASRNRGSTFDGTPGPSFADDWSL